MVSRDAGIGRPILWRLRATATRNDPVLLDSENLQPQMRAPTPQNVTVRSPRPRDYLTEREVEKLIDAARDNRWGHRERSCSPIATGCAPASGSGIR